MPTFTRSAIISSFMKLLDQRPLNKITVKDIVEDCGINRNSFYYYFQDLPALAEAVIKDETDRVLKGVSNISSLEDCLSSAVDLAVNNKNAVLHLYRSPSRELYEQHLNSITQYAVTEYINAVSKDMNIKAEDKEIIIKYFKCLLMGFILDWMNAGMKYDIKSTMTRVCELFGGSMQTALERGADSDK
ncbi:MAG: TetR/AcrR family transcriptional regulator [Ruminococcaceae bacterium]|nr:TetR/AcrR family transcriptional regulator [Oscillospiraceae bacterium]